MVTIPRIVTGEPPEWLTAHTARNMHEIGPSPATRREWHEAGLALPDVDRMRTERLARVRAELQATGCDAAILYDPLNIRYAVDTTNMSIWTMHNDVRFVTVNSVGPVIAYEYSNGEFLSLHNGCIDEVRPARSCHPFYTGDRLEEVVATWADETLAAIRPHAVSGGLRVAIDRLTLPCIRALEARGAELVFAQPLMERARLIKTADEIAAMRLACHSCDLIVAEMREALRPGMTEVEL